MSSRSYFSVSDGVLTISSDDSVELWTGMPDGLPVLDLRADPDGRSAVVLLDPPAGGGRVRNLVSWSRTRQAGCGCSRSSRRCDEDMAGRRESTSRN